MTTTFTYPGNRYRKHENQPTKDTVWNYTHDANGSITAKTSIGTGPDRLFAYSAHNRLLQVSEDDGAVTILGEYAYNGLGQRVRKDAGGESSEYRYGLAGELLAILDDTGQPVRELVYLNSQPLAVLDHEADAVYYVHNDHLGTPRALSDESGTRVWTAVYDPFGAATVDEDPDQDGVPVTLNLRFPGQYYDQETGLHYNYFRTLDPSTGRYLESDPIGLDGGLNTYGYVGGNPVGFIDPLGLETEVLIGGPNWYGHAALRIDGTVYSNGRYRTGVREIDNQRNSYIGNQALRGPNILRKQNAASYIERQNCPGCNLTGYVLDLNAAQEQRVKDFYNSLNLNSHGQLDEQYSFIGNNCADLTSEALKSGTNWYHDIFISDFLTSPGQLRFELNMVPFLVKEVRHYGGR